MLWPHSHLNGADNDLNPSLYRRSLGKFREIDCNSSHRSRSHGGFCTGHQATKSSSSFGFNGKANFCGFDSLTGLAVILYTLTSPPCKMTFGLLHGGCSRDIQMDRLTTRLVKRPPPRRKASQKTCTHEVIELAFML